MEESTPKNKELDSLYQSKFAVFLLAMKNNMNLYENEVIKISSKNGITYLSKKGLEAWSKGISVSVRLIASWAAYFCSCVHKHRLENIKRFKESMLKDMENSFEETLKKIQEEREKALALNEKQ